MDGDGVGDGGCLGYQWGLARAGREIWLEQCEGGNWRLNEGSSPESFEKKMRIHGGICPCLRCFCCIFSVIWLLAGDGGWILHVFFLAPSFHDFLHSPSSRGNASGAVKLSPTPRLL